MADRRTESTLFGLDDTNVDDIQKDMAKMIKEEYELLSMELISKCIVPTCEEIDAMNKMADIYYKEEIGRNEFEARQREQVMRLRMYEAGNLQDRLERDVIFQSEEKEEKEC